MGNNDNKPHFYLGSTGTTESYTYPRQVVTQVSIPAQNRSSHGGALLSQCKVVESHQQGLKDEYGDFELESGLGIQVSFESFPGVELAVESLADAKQGIELLNVQHTGSQVMATIYVPEGKLIAIESKIQAYIDRKKDKTGRPRDNQKLIDAIRSFRVAALESLWSDGKELLPSDENEVFWWEVWLPVFTDRRAVIHDFRKLAKLAELQVSQKVMEFPERSVLLVKGSRKQFASSSLLLSKVSEFRRAKETAAFFDELEPSEQPEWSDDLLGRLHQLGQEPPYICILDTGVNAEHPLLSPFIDSEDRYVVNPSWEINDTNGHGTAMAGLATWGDLSIPLQSSSIAQIGHKLESVKLLRFSGDNEGEHLGVLTADGVSLPEIENPGRIRIFSMALSSIDGRDRGRPSAWSSQIDSLAVDYLGDSLYPRLFIVCAGNTGLDLSALSKYPEHNELQDIHDPGQSWNAITVGAYTQKINLTEDSSFTTLAPSGGLSPYSTTSVMWQSSMPIKPEVVFEGGNVGQDRYSCAGFPCLKLLTTHNALHERLFTTAEATSAATQLAAKFAAEIYTQYPNLWPETVRALMVHSASWTEAMKSQFNLAATDKQRAKALVRRVGFGVPNLNQALWSAKNSLSLIVEDSLQPYQKLKGKSPSSRDMHIHEFPWPKDILLSLGEVDVEMTVTLSYFIEPNPSSRNVSGKYSYPSHQLRFDVKRPAESTNDFKRRLSKTAGDIEHGTTKAPSDSNWLLGDFRHKGSIHKDIWKGSAADLAERGLIAVYPAMGWWRTRTGLKKWDKSARYALIVTISAPKVDVDLYTAVDSQIAVKTIVET